jgi:hypothetical protein
MCPFNSGCHTEVAQWFLNELARTVMCNIETVLLYTVWLGGFNWDSEQN